MEEETLHYLYHVLRLCKVTLVFNKIKLRKTLEDAEKKKVGKSIMVLIV